MAKKIITQIKLQIPAGKANPSPPVGPALGPHGVNIMGVCNTVNAKTPSQENRGTTPRAKVEEIAKLKMVDLDVKDLAAAIKTIEGTARSMGLEVVGSLRPRGEGNAGVGGRKP